MGDGWRVHLISSFTPNLHTGNVVTPPNSWNIKGKVVAIFFIHLATKFYYDTRKAIFQNVESLYVFSVGFFRLFKNLISSKKYKVQNSKTCAINSLFFCTNEKIKYFEQHYVFTWNVYFQKWIFKKIIRFYQEGDEILRQWRN